MSDCVARRLAIVLVAVTAILVGALAAHRMLRTPMRHVELDTDRFPVRGIDVSAHNGLVHFDSLATAGIEFVFAKASEGASFRDRSFVLNATRAHRAGLSVGAYHFFRFDIDGATQAANFMEAVEGMPLELPLAIDVEEWGNEPMQPLDIVRERLRTMIAVLRMNGFNVLVYTNKQGLASFVRHHWSDHDPALPLWICSFTNPPLAAEPWVFWQHSHLGSLPGVKGDIDLNTFNGSHSEWKQWLRDNPTINKAARR